MAEYVAVTKKNILFSMHCRKSSVKVSFFSQSQTMPTTVNYTTAKLY